MKMNIKELIKKIIPYRYYYPFMNLYRKRRAVKFFGNKFYCPICEQGFDKFYEFGFTNKVIEDYEIVGAGLNKNGSCPQCLSNDRERHLYLYIKEAHEYLFSESIYMLHIAPEKNLYELFKSNKNINYLTGGFDMQLAMEKIDITKIPEKDNTFDFIICNHVLEHVPNDLDAIKELYRVLKKGGQAILQVPISFKNKKTFEDNDIFDPSDRLKYFGQSDHVRIYGLDYFERLESAGFSVNIVDFQSTLSKTELLKYSLVPQEKIFLCKKN